MSKMRGVAAFDTLWERRAVVSLKNGAEVPLLALPDLVAAKKTQRDKDWPMIRRLVEVHYSETSRDPSPQRIRFWLEEMRSPELLIEVVTRFPDEARGLAVERSAVAQALTGDVAAVQTALDEEMAREREADREYWAPLRKELEQLRMSRGRG